MRASTCVVVTRHVAPGSRPRLLAVLCAAVPVLLAACGGGGEPSQPKVRVPTTLAADGWQTLTGTVGQASTITPSVVVRDQDGAPLPGATVAFAVTSGGGTVATTSATTGSSGTASAGSWTFGTTAGTQSVRATVASLPPVEFTVAVNAGAPASVVAHEGDSQNAAVGSTVATLPAARVRDQFGNPVSGVAVTFAVTSGGGSVSGPNATTDANGVARPAAWTLGTLTGPNTLSATVNGVATPAIFTATAAAGPPAELLIETGNGQTGVVGAAVAIAPRVRLEDAHDNPVAGATISFSVTSGGGSAAPTTIVTDAQGRATVVSWTLGTTVGTNTLRAAYGGGSLTADFTAAANPDAPAKIVLVDGPSGSVRVGTVVSPSPAIRVTDRFDNPLPSVQVTFTPDAGDGTVAQRASTTGSDGIARAAEWTLGSTTGTQSLTASVDATLALRIDVNSVSGLPAHMFLERGGDQMARVATVLPIAPAVSVYDEFMNPVVGQVVTFTTDLATGGGSLTSPTPQTNAQGIAQVGSWTLGPDEGVQLIQASVPGISGSIAARAVPVSAFDIQVRYLTSATSAQRQAFTAAIERWSKVIIDDVTDIPITLAANICGMNEPALDETIDDLVIYVSLEPIDGPGMILGSAGPCVYRTATHQAIIGVMRFDTADLAEMESSGQLGDVILHEMAHVLGIGSSWSYFGLVSGAGTLDPYYTGPSGRAGWSLVGGDAYPGLSVPVENVGGAGTANSHWRNSVLGTELMTGFAEPGQRLPLSLVTIGGLEDLGYGITPYGYDVYQFGAGMVRAAPGTTRQLREVPLPKAPIEVDEGGRVVGGAARTRAAMPVNRGRVRGAMSGAGPKELVRRPAARPR